VWSCCAASPNVLHGLKEAPACSASSSGGHHDGQVGLNCAQTTRTCGCTLLHAGGRPLLGRACTLIFSPGHGQTGRQAKFSPGIAAACLRACQGSGARARARRQLGIVNFEPLKPLFLEVHAAALAVAPGLPGTAPLAVPLERGGGADEGAPARAPAPVQPFSLALLEARLQARRPPPCMLTCSLGWPVRRSVTAGSKASRLSFKHRGRLFAAYPC